MRLKLPVHWQNSSFSVIQMKNICFSPTIKDISRRKPSLWISEGQRCIYLIYSCSTMSTISAISTIGPHQGNVFNMRHEFPVWSHGEASSRSKLLLFPSPKTNQHTNKTKQTKINIYLSNIYIKNRWIVSLGELHPLPQNKQQHKHNK